MDRAYRRKDAAELIKLAGCATRDWEIQIGKTKPTRHESHEAAVSELLSDYTGMPSDEVAWRLGQDEKWVRRQRIVKGRDPDHGRPRQVDPRTAHVLELHKRGVKQRIIAEEVGITQGRVSQILNGRR